MKRVQHYVALGDSIQIDDYPGAGLGAASLLHRNVAHFPEFAGRDLRSANPDCVHTNLCMDGATTGLTLDFGVPGLEVLDPTPDLITLTAGGNDFVPLFGTTEDDARAEIMAIVARLGTILEAVRAVLPDAHVLLGTVYDPSDGTGEMVDVSARDWPIGPALFVELNDQIRALAADRAVTLVDIHRHFHGHGALAGDIAAPPPGTPDLACWYCNVIEPNQAGAHEVRRLFVEALEASDGGTP